MLERYSPYELFPIADPIFERERKLLQVTQPDQPAAFRGDVKVAFLLSGLLQISAIIGIFATSRTGWFMAVALSLLLLAQLIATLGVDLFNVVTTTFFWRTRSNPETLDLLRMTRQDDELLLAYQSAAELRSWRAMRIETIIRLIIPATLLIIGVLLSPAIFTALLYLLTPDTMFFLLLAFTMLLFAARMLLLYVREPLARMRVVVALSIYIATRLRDAASATLISSLIVILLRLLQVALLYPLIVITWRLLENTGSSYGYNPHGVLLWLWLLILGFAPVVRWGYRVARHWLLRQIAATLRA